MDTKQEMLVQEAQAGDKDAFTALLRENEQRMYKVARSFLNCEDQMQEQGYYGVSRENSLFSGRMFVCRAYLILTSPYLVDGTDENDRKGSQKNTAYAIEF